MPPTFANGKICYIEIPATDHRSLGGILWKSVWLAHPATWRRYYRF